MTAPSLRNNWWTIPLPNGCSCIDLSNGETVNVWFLDDLPQHIIEHGIDGLDCGPNDLRVFHFPLRIDIGIFHAVDRLLAKGFDSRPGIFAAFYGKSTKRELERIFEAADTREQLLGGGIWHSVTPVRTERILS